MEKASACARAVKPEAKILPKKEEMPACGQRALARVSYMTSTRAKAQLTPNQTDQFYTGKLTLFAPGLTLGSLLQSDKMAREFRPMPLSRSLRYQKLLQVLSA